jgi:hypothetical protein
MRKCNRCGKKVDVLTRVEIGFAFNGDNIYEICNACKKKLFAFMNNKNSVTDTVYIKWKGNDYSGTA